MSTFVDLFFGVFFKRIISEKPPFHVRMSFLSLQSTIGKDTLNKNQVKNQLPKTQVLYLRRSRERVVEAGGSGGKVGGVVSHQMWRVTI